MALLAEGAGLLTPLQSLILDAQIPVWGTCAGLILLSSSAVNTKAGGQRLLGGLDISIQRNAFGRQAQSFVLPLEMPILGPEPLQGVFIRAPAISPLEPGKDSQVRILAKLPVTHGSHIVAVQQGHILGTAFHPELTSDSRMHEYFMQMVSDKRAGTKSN